MVSKCGEGAHLLYLLQEEGHECRINILEPGYSDVFEGLLERVPLKNIWIDKSTIIIFDSSGNGNIADQFIKEGYTVFGASGFHDDLENDRNFGLEVMQECEIPVPEAREFRRSQSKLAMDFVMRNSDRRWVFKPSGDLPSKLTYVSKNADELNDYIDHVISVYGTSIKTFVLQEFVEGIAVSSEYWCGPKGFVGPPNHTVETKKFLNDNLGPSTGCSGNAIWLADPNSLVVKNGVAKIEKILVENDYIGPIDLNCMVNDKGIFGLEWTPRFGLDAMPTILQMLNCQVSEFINTIAYGEDGSDLFKNTIAAGVRLSIPPYPLEPKKVTAVQEVSPNLDIPIQGFQDYIDNCYFYEVKVKDSKLVHSSGTGAIGVISDTGDTISSALKKPYAILKQIALPDKQYRTDIVKTLEEMYEETCKCLK